MGLISTDAPLAITPIVSLKRRMLIKINSEYHIVPIKLIDSQKS
nr:MAG TPA: hypothetical protein [Bacteriophage sp.]